MSTEEGRWLEGLDGQSERDYFDPPSASSPGGDLREAARAALKPLTQRDWPDGVIDALFAVVADEAERRADARYDAGRLSKESIAYIYALRSLAAALRPDPQEGAE